MKRMAFEQTTACEPACFEKWVLCKGRYGIIGAGGDKTAVRTKTGRYQHLVTAYEKYGDPVNPVAGLRYRTKYLFIHSNAIQVHEQSNNRSISLAMPA